MDNEENEVSHYHVQRAARLVGRMLARGGDFYDVVEEIAEGWALESEIPADDAARAAYMRPVKSGSELDVDGDTIFSRDQGEPAPPTDDGLRLQLAALNELQSVALSQIAWRVDDARNRGWAWSKVGDALEISKQAAQQRFGTKPTAAPLDSDPLF